MSTISRVDDIEDRLIRLEGAVGELGHRVQGIHRPERFRAMMPRLAPFVEKLRAERAAARAETAEPKPTTTVPRIRYAPVFSRPPAASRRPKGITRIRSFDDEPFHAHDGEHIHPPHAEDRPAPAD